MTTQQGLTLDEVKAHPYFVRLTSQQQTFVLTICSNGNNKIAAAHKAWQCKSDESARAFANKTLAKPDIKWIVSKFYGVSAEDEPFTREEMMSFLSRKARTVADEKLVYNYARAIMDLNGWETKPSDPVRTPNGEGSLMDEVLELENSVDIPKPRAD